MYSKLALITILDGSPEIGGGPATPPVYPSHGLPGGGHPSTGPVYPPGHPSAGLPISPGHPSTGFPPTYPTTGPVPVPPNVVWPPQLPPSTGEKPDVKPVPPTDVKPIDPSTPLPAGSAVVLVYSADKGWRGGVVSDSGSGTKPVEPSQPKR